MAKQSSLMDHPTIRRIIALVPTDLRDDLTGTGASYEVYLNTYTKITPRSYRGGNSDGIDIKSVTLKAGSDARKRTYSVNNSEGRRPLSYHFWKSVRGHTERQGAISANALRDKRLQKIAFDVVNTYIEFAEDIYGSKIDPYSLSQARAGISKSVTVGTHSRFIGDTDADALCLNFVLYKGLPKLTKLTINNCHLSLDTVKKIMALADGDSSIPEDQVKNSREVKKERESLFD